MPGLVAILTTKHNGALASCIIPMAEVMCHESFHKLEVFNDSSMSCAAARVHIGAVNVEAQPVFSEDRSVFVFMEGEIYARDELIRGIRSSPCGSRTLSDAALLLRLYELRGERFAEELNGSFLAVLHDHRENKTIIANDCLGLCPAFYVQKDGAFFLASEVKSLLRCARVSRTVNIEKLGQYFLYDGIMDDETLIKDIKRLPNGSIWTYRGGDLTKAQYFDLASIIQKTSMKKQEFAEETRRLFLKIMPRYTSGSSVALSLTGGWDTRAIFATTQKLGYSLPCFTLGGAYRDSMDITLAAKMAAALDQQLTRFYVGKDFFEDFPNYARKAIYISDGVANVFQTDNLYFYPRVRELARIRLSGAYGTQTMDGTFLLQKSRFDPRILSSRYIAELGPLQKYERCFNGGQAIIDVIRWLWPQGYRALQRCYVEERTPFVDRDLISFLFCAPQTYLAGASIQKHIVSQNCPPLGDFPADRGTFIRTGNFFRDSRLRIVCGLIKLGIKLDRGYLAARLPHWLTKLDPIMVGTRAERLFLGRSNQLSYRHWVKYELREFFESILEDEKTLSRPYLNPDFVRKMTADHFSHRANYLNEICKIVSLELWHRHFIDKEPAQYGWQHG